MNLACLPFAQVALAVATAGPLPEPAPPPPPARAVSITVDIVALGEPYVDLVSELRLSRKFSLALRAGGGSRNIELGAAPTTLAWEIGVEPRWYFIGNFSTGFYAAWSTRFDREHIGAVGFEDMRTPPGFSSGLLAGFKSVDVPVITPDVSVGVLFPIVVPGSEICHPPAAIVLRLGIGVSL